MFVLRLDEEGDVTDIICVVMLFIYKFDIEIHIILQPIIRRLCIYHCRLLVLTINRIILAWRSRITR